MYQSLSAYRASLAVHSDTRALTENPAALLSAVGFFRSGPVDAVAPLDALGHNSRLHITIQGGLIMPRKERQVVVYTNQNKNLLPVDLPSFTVANALDPADNEGRIIFVSNGAAGLPIVAYSTGTDWLRVDTREAIAAA